MQVLSGTSSSLTRAFLGALVLSSLVTDTVAEDPEPQATESMEPITYEDYVDEIVKLGVQRRTNENARASMEQACKLMGRWVLHGEPRDAAFYDAFLDHAGIILFETRDGFQFGADAGNPFPWDGVDILETFDGSEHAYRSTMAWLEDARMVCMLQASLAGCTEGFDVEAMSELKGWPRLRNRCARLLMNHRATWVMLYDPKMANTRLGASSEVDTRKMSRREMLEETVESKATEIRVYQQRDLKVFMKEFGPKIDKFMVAAFKKEPQDLRGLNEYLVLGRYTTAERAELLKAIVGDLSKLPPLLRVQFSALPEK